MLRWIILIIALGLMFSSCEKECMLTQQVRVQFDWEHANFNINQTAEWNGYTAAQLKSELTSAITTSFNDPDQMLIVDSLPDYIIRIDSITAYTYDQTETRTTPCSTRGWLGNFLLGPDENTFHLHGISLYVRINLLNAQTHTGKILYPGTSDSQQITQPPSSDSVNCNDYVVEGTPSTANVISSSGFYFHNLIRCQIHSWQNP